MPEDDGIVKRDVTVEGFSIFRDSQGFLCFFRHDITTYEIGRRMFSINVLS